MAPLRHLVLLPSEADRPVPKADGELRNLHGLVPLIHVLLQPSLLRLAEANADLVQPRFAVVHNLQVAGTVLDVICGLKQEFS